MNDGYFPLFGQQKAGRNHRIVEYPELGGTCKDHRVQLPLEQVQDCSAWVDSLK